MQTLMEVEYCLVMKVNPAVIKLMKARDQHQGNNEGKDNSSIYQFKQEERRKSLQKNLKSSGYRGWS